MGIRAVLFDFDGTLTRPGALDFAAIKRDLGCPPELAILEFLDGLPAGERARLTRRLEEHEDLAAAASVPNHGAEACLAWLKTRGIPMGILTRNSLSSVCKALSRFQAIEPEDFDPIITRDESLPKPHPDGVLQAAGRMQVRPRELMVVGDFRFDVLAGHAAGAVTVLLTNGSSSVMLPEDPEPCHVIQHLEELRHLLKRGGHPSITQ